MQLVGELVELLVELLFLLLHVLELLQFDLVFPLDLLVTLLCLHYPLLALAKLAHDHLILLPLNLQLSHLSVSFEKRDLNKTVFFLGLHFVPVLVHVVLLGAVQVFLKASDDVDVRCRDLEVEILDVLVLLGVFRLEVVNSLHFLALNLSDFHLSLLLHVASKQDHLMLVLGLDFVGDALVLLTDVGRFLVVGFRQRVQVLVVTVLLLFLGDFE